MTWRTRMRRFATPLRIIALVVHVLLGCVPTRPGGRMERQRACRPETPSESTRRPVDLKTMKGMVKNDTIPPEDIDRRTAELVAEDENASNARRDGDHEAAHRHGYAAHCIAEELARAH